MTPIQNKNLGAIAQIIKYLVYGAVVITVAWLALCGVIVIATGSTDGLGDAGAPTLCLVHALITEPTATVVSAFGAQDHDAAARGAGDVFARCLGDRAQRTA